MNATGLFKNLTRGCRVLRLCVALVLRLVGAHSAHAADWAPSELLLDAIRHIESADGRMLVGDQGRSLGAYQLSKGAWLDVNSWRKGRGLPTMEYQSHVWTESSSRQYAADYLVILHSQLEKYLTRPPSAGELYAAYNMGFTCFARCQCSLAHVNPVTADKCRQIEAVMFSYTSSPTLSHTSSHTLSPRT